MRSVTYDYHQSCLWEEKQSWGTPSKACAKRGIGPGTIMHKNEHHIYNCENLKLI